MLVKEKRRVLIISLLRSHFAVRGGFEPPVRFHVRMFSKHVVSATHPPHRCELGGKCNKTVSTLQRIFLILGLKLRIFNPDVVNTF